MAEYEEKTVVETQPTEPEYDGGRNWLRLVGMVLAAIIIAILLIFAARFVYNAITDNDSRQTNTGPQTDNDAIPARPDAEKDKTASQSGTGTSSKSTTGTAPGSQPSRTSTQLPNSGPAHVAAIFAGSSLAGAGLHYIVARKRKA